LGNASASPAATAVAATAAPRADIVQNGGDISLGGGWYAYETYKGRSFRWVDNDAAFVLHGTGPLAKIAIALEPGPGLGTTGAFSIYVVGAGGQIVATAPVRGQQRVRFDLPAQAGKNTTYRLHITGGGKKIAKDPRILNFRVFRIADASGDATLGAGHPDIVSGKNIRLGANWYPLEQFANETFRWVSDDAQIIVDSNQTQTRRLKVVAAAGPSVKSPSDFMLSLLDQNGRTLQAGKIKARGIVYLSLPLKAGTNVFMLHADSTGKRAPNDPRILDFRVFEVSIL
jgi:hypothetical protein